MLVHRDLPLHGGITRSFLSILSRLNRDTIFPAVLSLERIAGKSREKFEKAKIRVYELGAGRLRQAWRFRKAVADFGPELVCCTSFRAYVLAKTAQRSRNFRTVFWIHGIPILRSMPKRFLFRLLARRDTLFAVSQAAMDAHSFPSHRGRTVLCPNGVSSPPATVTTDDIRVAARAEMSLRDDEIAIGYVAEFTDWKEHKTLFKAFEVLAGTRPRLKLVLFGTGRTEASVRAIATPLGGRVRFMGVRPDVRLLMAGFDVYAHPASAEAFGMAVVEAMLAEVPVVAARAGALPEIIEEGRTGWLFRAGDAGDLARVLCRILDDRPAARTVARQAAQEAADRFGVERAARELESALLAEFEGNRA